jgi:hypothetical protein
MANLMVFFDDSLSRVLLIRSVNVFRSRPCRVRIPVCLSPLDFYVSADKLSAKECQFARRVNITAVAQ